MKRAPQAVLALLAGAGLALLANGCASPWMFGGPATMGGTTSQAADPTKISGLPSGSPEKLDSPAVVAGNTAMTIPWPAEPPLYEPVQMAAYEASGVTPWPDRIAQNFPSTAPPPEPPLYTPWENPLARPASQEPALTYQFPSAPLTPVGRLGEYWGETKLHAASDYRNYYRWRSLLDLGIGVGLAAPLANTSLDHDFRDWYQQDVRSPGSDDLSSFWKPWGEGKIFIPAWVGLAVVGKMLDDRPVFSVVGDFSDRTTRAYLVGAPPMLLMQYVLGASRPGETPDTSHWKPFDDTNAVSGHAFIGAVPFLTAANMVENPWAKGTFYALSTFTGWSRVNDDSHYLSQVCLGWYMAYLAARAVDQTEHAEQQFRVVPIASQQMTGLGIVVRR